MSIKSEARKGKLYLWATLCVIVISLATPRYLDLVARLGHFVPQNDMATDYVKGLFWAIFLGLTIVFWPVSSANKKNLLLAWLAKCVLTLIVMLFYESHYGSDANMYFGASRGLAEYSGYAFLGGTARMINLARLHNALLADSYHAMKVTCSMLGLVGIYLIYRASVMFRQSEDKRLFFVLAFFPGILFWSSILGKDPLVFFAIDLYAYGVVGWYCRRSLRFLVCIASGIAMAVIFREWLGPIMLFPLGVFILNGVRGAFQRGVLLVLVTVLLLFTAQATIDRFKLSAVQDVVSTVQMASGNMAQATGGSTQQMALDFSSIGSIVSFLPLTTFTALFRPLLGEVLNPFGFLAGLESSLLLFLLWRAMCRTGLQELKEPLVMWAILFVLVWAVVNGIVSSMNFGLTVRYKLQILPILLGVLLYLARKRPDPEANGCNRE